MIRRPPRSTLSSSSAASDVYKRQLSLREPTVLTTAVAAARWSARKDPVQSPVDSRDGPQHGSRRRKPFRNPTRRRLARKQYGEPTSRTIPIREARGNLSGHGMPGSPNHQRRLPAGGTTAGSNVHRQYAGLLAA